MAAVRVSEADRRPFYTTESLARLLSMSERAVRDLLKDGKIASYKIGGARRIDPDDVDRFLQSCREDVAA